MEALKSLTTNIPDWVKRLDDLNGQIAQRQLDLAKLTESRAEGGRSGSAAAPKSMKNRGSTESLKPKDDMVAHPAAGPPTEKAREGPASDAAPIHPPLEKPQRQASRGAAAAAQPPSSPESDGMSRSPSTLRRQTNQVMAVAQAKARATLRKRNRTESMISAEDAPKYRTRSMIIVYYDSYVQSFFEELVKFVSASRNLMRKAKMAAKVAQIKKMAELDMPDVEDDHEAKDGAHEPSVPLSLTPDAPLEASSKRADEEEELTTLRYISTRQMRQISRTPGMMGPGRSPYSRVGARFGGGAALMSGGDPDKSDVYDDLDKGLEAVQSMCERAAHQFLRDGDCAEEIDTIKKRLGQTKELSDKETERVRKEDPDAVKDEPATKTRSFRPHSMRLPSAGSSPPKETAQPESGLPALEVDEGVDDMDKPPPKLVFKSTRTMR